MILLQLIFWIALLLIAHSYIFFPLILKILAVNKTAEAKPKEKKLSDPPFISVLIAAYNEEEVIKEKITSVLFSDYPRDKMEIIVGSDASTDQTNDILEKIQQEENQLSFIPFTGRTGKPGIINHLATLARGEILVITDANVMLEKDSLRELAGSFQNPSTGLVDTRMINTQLMREGISHQEKFYINREVRIKHHESLLWGSMMGPFGGCYAVRKELYQPVPEHFLVDDFFVNMTVLRQGFRCESNLDARVSEDAGNDHREEFRRKKRISAGNFQNLVRFFPLLLSRKKGIAFCFFSHKTLRWITPLLVGLSLGASMGLGLSEGTIAGPLSWMKEFYLGLALSQILFLFMPVIDQLLRIIRIHILPLRFVSHFVLMNMALLAGFFRFLKGIESNVWKPTRRNQGTPE